ncbi:porin [Psychromonas aquimarina]|uniref:porin n=1 Tax=Psychromonas aquimarina TaxID=444919 RepID=UPI00040EF230|nr:porin [Psychromonas aquimarina]
MFKKTLVAASLATAAMGVSAYQIGENNDFNVEVYGVAAISVVNYNTTNSNDVDSTGYNVENESRIGFRAGKPMTDSIEVFMQVESGYVGHLSEGGNDENEAVAGGQGTLGFRDTFVGLKGDWGKVRVGRVLTPMYELVDWPYANPGLGASWDWGGDVAAIYDRHSESIRYDSPAFGGFTFAAATGRGDSSVKDSNFYGANAKYTFNTVTLMGAVETSENFKGAVGTDTLGYLVGFEAGLPGGFGLAGAYKVAESETAGAKHTQGSYSIIAQYWNGPLGVKVGYTANLESELESVKQDDADSIASIQVMGVIEGFVPYVRLAARDTYNGKNSGDTGNPDIVTRVGLEYGF